MNGSERRQYDRVPFRTELTIIDLATQVRYSGFSIDLSLGGMGFYAERFFEKGTPVDIVARDNRPGREGATRITGTVQWARVEGDGAIIGVRFSRLLSPEAYPELCERLCSV
jgi:c-di-GMP-binding flagellar brake protein YcgR